MANKINIVAGLYECKSFEEVTVSSTALGLNNYFKNGEYAKRVVITIQDAQIRYRYDGVNPTASLGHVCNPFDVITLVGTQNIQNFRAIRKGSSDAKISISYEF